MSGVRQRLLPIARRLLALLGVLRAFRASANQRLKGLAEQPSVRRLIARLKLYAINLRRTVEHWRGETSLGAAREPVAGALVKISERSRVLLTLPSMGRALVKRVPAPVQVELRKLSSGGAHVCREIFAGVLVVGLIAIVGGYGRLAGGPISLPSLVPMIEDAINGELSDLHVKIDDAILQRSPDGPGVLFRLRNIRLIDTDGSIVAQAPLAAIGMSGAALLSGRVAPGSVDFIGPKLLFYASDNGLSLSFYRPSSSDVEKFIKGSVPGAAPPPAPEAKPGTPAESVISKRSEVAPPMPTSAGRQLDVTRTVTEIFGRARRGNTSYLTRFGVKDAEVVLSRDGVQTLWQVPDFSIDLRHKDQRSVLVGQGNLGSSKGDWQLEFRTEQRRKSLSITALIQDLVPSGLVENFPAVAVLKVLDLPIAGETSVELSTAGHFLSGKADLQLKPGHITPPWDPDNAMGIDEGDLHVRYAKNGDLKIEPSTLKWGQSEATVSGEFQPAGEDNGSPSWTFRLKANDAVLGAAEVGLPPIKVDEWSAEGTVTPDGGRVTLSRFIIRSGSASIELAGSVVDAPGSPEIHLTGVVSPMPIDVLKQFWPKFLAGEARIWVAKNVSGGQVLGGKVAISLAAGELARMEAGGELAPDAVNVSLDLAGMSLTYIEKLPPILTGNAKLIVSGTTFSVDIPEAKVALPSGQEIGLSEGRYFIPDLRVDPKQAEITFKAYGATGTVLQLLDHEPLGYIQALGMKPEYFGGTAAGSFVLDMPMREDLRFEDIKLRGAARFEHAIATDVIGKVDVEGGALEVNVTEQALDVRGQILIKGVPAELAWQRIFYEPDERQPPIRVSATLDETAREALGLKISHLVHGPLPVTLSITRHSDGAQALSMQADLTQAQLIFGNMGWTKPPGRSATLQFDVVPGEDGSIDLKNLKILGDDIAIDGSISFDPEQHLKSFHFSDFSFDVLTHVEINATVHDGNRLEVDAHGPSYNGKQFFQSLFSAGQLAEDSDARDPFSVDLVARLGTVVGFYDTTVNDAQVTLSKRNGRLVSLNATGKLNGRTPIAVKLAETNGARIVHAESRDAGAAFRLIGFYPKVDGGEASLEVNLDASEPGMKTGTLWARNFAVLGDSVVSDVLTDPQSMAALGERKKEVRQSRISFNQLRAPFSVGKGQFLLNDAYVNGPALGATMRGRVDFKVQTVNLGGTYVPLYGLNSALGAIPILGGIFVGRQGEGVVGITFAIQGQLDDPNVLVNPISVVAPGIFRQIFEFRAEGQNAASSTGTSPSDFGDPAH